MRGVQDVQPEVYCCRDLRAAWTVVVLLHMMHTFAYSAETQEGSFRTVCLGVSNVQLAGCSFLVCLETFPGAMTCDFS